MKYCILLVTMVFFFAGEAVAAQQEGPEGTKAIYQNICQACHGETGDGNGPIAPTLRTKPRDFKKLTKKSEEHLFKVIKEGGAAVKLSPLMPPYGPQLKDEEIREMVRHVLSFNQSKK